MDCTAADARCWMLLSPADGGCVAVRTFHQCEGGREAMLAIFLTTLIIMLLPLSPPSVVGSALQNVLLQPWHQLTFAAICASAACWY